jgi:general secretion pathway protein K
MTEPARRERGFALLLVIALLALMAALALDFTALARSGLYASRNAVELARARLLADAGYALALNDLLNPLQGAVEPADGSNRKIVFDGGSIDLSVQDESGKIDLNWAPVELISRALGELAIPGDVEARILGVVDDRRTEIPVPEYAPGDIVAGGLMGGPTREKLAFRPFASVGDLQSLASIDSADFDRITAIFTVYSESRRINPYTAPRPVLMAMPGMTEELADAVIAARAGGGAGAPLNTAQLTVNIGNSTQSGLRAATIIADAVTDRGVRFVRRAIVSFTGLPSAPIRVLDWRQQLQ